MDRRGQPVVNQSLQPIYKLHGSTSWRTAGGANVLVLGAAKAQRFGRTLPQISVVLDSQHSNPTVWYRIEIDNQQNNVLDCNAGNDGFCRRHNSFVLVQAVARAHSDTTYTGTATAVPHAPLGNSLCTVLSMSPQSV